MQKLKQKILDETGDLKINTVYKFLRIDFLKIQEFLNFQALK